MKSGKSSRKATNPTRVVANIKRAKILTLSFGKSYKIQFFVIFILIGAAAGFVTIRTLKHNHDSQKPDNPLSINEKILSEQEDLNNHAISDTPTGYTTNPQAIVSSPPEEPDNRKHFENSDKSLKFKYPQDWQAQGERYYFSYVKSPRFTNDIFKNSSKQGYFILIFFKKDWGTEWGTAYNLAVKDSTEVIFDHPTSEQGEKTLISYTGKVENGKTYIWTIDLGNTKYKDQDKFVLNKASDEKISTRTFELAGWNTIAYYAYDDDQTNYFYPLTAPIEFANMNLNGYFDTALTILKSAEIKPSLVAY